MSRFEAFAGALVALCPSSPRALKTKNRLFRLWNVPSQADSGAYSERLAAAASPAAAGLVSFKTTVNDKQRFFR